MSHITTTMGRISDFDNTYTKDANCTSSSCYDNFAIPSYDAVLFVSAFALMLLIIVGCWAYHAGRSMHHFFLFCRADSDGSWCSYIRYYLIKICCCAGCSCCRCCDGEDDDTEDDVESGRSTKSDGGDCEKVKHKSTVSKPLSRLLRDSVRRVLFRQNICSICLEDFTSSKSTTIYQTPCKHFFHSSCIRKWMKVTARGDVASLRKSCPVCRKHIDLNDGVHSKVTSKLHYIWSVELPQSKSKQSPGNATDEEGAVGVDNMLCTLEDENPVPSCSSKHQTLDCSAVEVVVETQPDSHPSTSASAQVTQAAVENQNGEQKETVSVERRKEEETKDKHGTPEQDEAQGSDNSGADDSHNHSMMEKF